jgi:hypothetical protein
MTEKATSDRTKTTQSGRGDCQARERTRILHMHLVLSGHDSSS